MSIRFTVLRNVCHVSADSNRSSAVAGCGGGRDLNFQETKECWCHWRFPGLVPFTFENYCPMTSFLHFYGRDNWFDLIFRDQTNQRLHKHQSPLHSLSKYSFSLEQYCLREHTFPSSAYSSNYIINVASRSFSYFCLILCQLQG